MPYRDPDQQRAYQRQWLQRRRQAWIAANGPCARCGSSEDLEVDHRDRRGKALRVASLWSRKSAARDRELAKCQVLCRECHLEKSRECGDWGPTPPGQIALL